MADSTSSSRLDEHVPFTCSLYEVIALSALAVCVLREACLPTQDMLFEMKTPAVLFSTVDSHLSRRNRLVSCDIHGNTMFPYAVLSPNLCIYSRQPNVRVVKI